MSLVLETIALASCLILVKSVDRQASLVVLPPLILGYDELYEDNITNKPNPKGKRRDEDNIETSVKDQSMLEDKRDHDSENKEIDEVIKRDGESNNGTELKDQSMLEGKRDHDSVNKDRGGVIKRDSKSGVETGKKDKGILEENKDDINIEISAVNKADNENKAALPVMKNNIETGVKDRGILGEIKDNSDIKEEISAVKIRGNKDKKESLPNDDRKDAGGSPNCRNCRQNTKERVVNTNKEKKIEDSDILRSMNYAKIEIFTNPEVKNKESNFDENNTDPKLKNHARFGREAKSSRSRHTRTSDYEDLSVPKQLRNSRPRERRNSNQDNISLDLDLKNTSSFEEEFIQIALARGIPEEIIFEKIAEIKQKSYMILNRLKNKSTSTVSVPENNVRADPYRETSTASVSKNYVRADPYREMEIMLNKLRHRNSPSETTHKNNERHEPIEVVESDISGVDDLPKPNFITYFKPRIIQKTNKIAKNGHYGHIVKLEMGHIILPKH